MLAAGVAAAGLLSLERIFYVWVWNRPATFTEWCGACGFRDPVDALELAFVVFKLIQICVFLWWCHVAGGGPRWPGDGGSPATLAGVTLLIVGQYLNYSVFRSLGRIGVFYGARFGRSVPWCTTFPFSVLRHPQYVGAVLSIWGFFLLVAFPHPGWFVLPALESIYYALAASLER